MFTSESRGVGVSALLFVLCMRLNSCQHSENNDKLHVLSYGPDDKGCEEYWNSEQDNNLTLQMVPSLSNSFHLQCDWVFGVYADGIRIRFILVDFPEPSVTGRCDIAYLMFGGFNYDGERIIYKKSCGRFLPKTYQNTRWVTLVWTGKQKVMTKPISIQAQLVKEIPAISLRTILIGLVFFVSLFIVCALPCIYAMHKERVRQKMIGIWSPTGILGKPIYTKEIADHIRQTEEKVEDFKEEKKYSEIKDEQSIGEKFLRRSLNRSRGSYQRVKEEDASDNTHQANPDNSSKATDHPVSHCLEAVVHCQRSPCPVEPSCSSDRNATILQSILQQLSKQSLDDDSSNSTTDNPDHLDNCKTTMQQGLASAVTSNTIDAKDCSFSNIEGSLLPISQHQFRRQSLASICSETSFCSNAYLNENHCSTPQVNAPNRNAVIPMDREIMFRRTGLIHLPYLKPIRENEKEDFDDTANSNIIIENQRSDGVQCQMLREENNSNRSSSRTEQALFKKATFMFEDHRSREENQEMSFVSLIPDSDFTHVSSLCLSSCFEPADNFKLDTDLNFQEQKPMQPLDHFQRSDECFSQCKIAVIPQDVKEMNMELKSKTGAGRSEQAIHSEVLVSDDYGSQSCLRSGFNEIPFNDSFFSPLRPSDNCDFLQFVNRNVPVMQHLNLIEYSICASDQEINSECASDEETNGELVISSKSKTLNQQDDVHAGDVRGSDKIFHVKPISIKHYDKNGHVYRETIF